MLVDPGPESSLHTLLEKLGDQRPEAILLTHIHLDHAAATGAMVARWPDLPVYVHERGAPHIIDPSRACWPAPSASTATNSSTSGGRSSRSPRPTSPPSRAARWCAGCASPTPPATPPTTSPTSTRRPAPPSSATSPPAASPAPTWSSRRPRRRTSTSSSGKSRSPPSRPGRRRSSPSPTSARSRTRPPTSPRRRRRLREEAELARGMDEATYEADLQRRIAAQLDPETADGDVPGRPDRLPVVRPRPLLAQESRARGLR